MHCHITRKYRDSAHRDCDINLQLNHKIFVVYHNLKNDDSHLIMKDYDFHLIITSHLHLERSAIPIGLEKYMSFGIRNKLSFIDRFQFLGSTLD